ncbi:uncharacterized protein [Physcomitrium patens]|uniref:Glucosidase II beta subunit N-terminal domain-containing protein n=2 Tax=Physcomitrium patens TaxID=3218 RepID=A0A7I4FFJ5_PHYPA|nr:glucosidase 2 subunit beta-like isoform X2 [Physcomitrium patens]|eukprot:XP_024361417.1 glucosidase 2 subunit beta-like isoform X2 [Physcomitrella patens]
MNQRRLWCISPQLRRCLLSMLRLILLWALVDRALAGNKVRGIDPQDLSYFQEYDIWCKDGSKSFPRERLNDNFCDCPDGTDEPGTSACPNSKFYCRNVGSAPKLVFASRVNDGICDCCDGSDEYEKRVNCANACGGGIIELSGNLEVGSVQSTTLDSYDDFQVIPYRPRKEFEESFASKLKDMKVAMLMTQWLPLSFLLFLLLWMWARGPLRLQLRRKKVSRAPLVCNML